MRPERRALQLWELREEELSEGRAEVLPQGSSAGITGGGDCRRDRRRRALMPPLSPPVTPEYWDVVAVCLAESYLFFFLLFVLSGARWEKLCN